MMIAEMMLQDDISIMTHIALVSTDGEIDATLAPSYEAALDLLRERAQSWDFLGDPDHPLDCSTMTLEQLSELYDLYQGGNTGRVAIAFLWDHCLALTSPTRNTVQQTPTPLSSRVVPSPSFTVSACTRLLLACWVSLCVLGILTPTFPMIAGVFVPAQCGLVLLGASLVVRLLALLVDPTPGQPNGQDQEEDGCDA